MALTYWEAGVIPPLGADPDDELDPAGCVDCAGGDPEVGWVCPECRIESRYWNDPRV